MYGPKLLLKTSIFHDDDVDVDDDDDDDDDILIYV